nr:probable terpene synthase 6 [Tanacetum cinerariifolium]
MLILRVANQRETNHFVPPAVYSHRLFMDLNEEYVTNPLLDDIPDIFQRYIKDLNNVKGDGNYGFRSVAVGLGRDENLWPLIRQELLQELRRPVVFISMVKNDVPSSTCFLLWSGPHKSESTEPIVVARVGGSNFINLML